MEAPTVEVKVTVAISEAGATRCCIADSSWITQQRAHKAFMDELRQDKQLWHCKTVKVRLPMPVEYEDIGIAT